MRRLLPTVLLLLSTTGTLALANPGNGHGHGWGRLSNGHGHGHGFNIVPEPTNWLLLTMGIVGLVLMGRLRD